MAERYTKLFSLPENLYEKDCPVMICAGALSKDNQTDKVFVQLRFQNVDSRYRTIVAVKVALQPFGIAYNPLGNSKEYQYLDIKVERGSDAGSKQPVYLDDNTARSFSVSVLEVVFEDGSVWTGNAQNWCSLQQTKLEDKFSNDLMEQYQRDTFAEAKYEPFAKDGIWMCACGTLNTIEDSKCCRCHAEKVKQFAALDHNSLANHFQEHTEKELVELKKEKEEGQKKKRKVMRLSCIALVLIGLLVASPSIFLGIKSNPIKKQLIGTSWSTWGFGSISFLDGNTVLVDEYSGDEIKGSWKVVDFDYRYYSYYLNGWDYKSESIHGDAMRICITYRDSWSGYENTEYIDFFYEKVNGQTILTNVVFNPPGAGNYYGGPRLMS